MSGHAMRTGMTLRWVQVGAFCGLAATVAYPTLILAPLPIPLIVAVACIFGLCLGAASLGLYHLLGAHQPTIRATLATVFNFAGGALFISMVLVQMAVRSYWVETGGENGPIGEQFMRLVWHVQLGLDVAWDAYIGMGTFLFAWAMIGHPRFGKVFGAAGMIVAVVLLWLNLYTFPTPPANAGWFDAGPLLGLWYLAVTIQTFRSFGWVREATS